MLKFTNNLANANLVLVRKQIGDRACSALILMRSPHRNYASSSGNKSLDCQPKPEPPKSRKFLYSSLGALLLTGATVYYIKHNNEARGWVNRNMRPLDEFVSLVYQEDQTYLEFASDKIEKVSKYVQTLMFGKEHGYDISANIRMRSQQDPAIDCATAVKKPEYQLPEPNLLPLYVPHETNIEPPPVLHEATVVQTEECEPQNTDVIVNVTKDLVVAEQEMLDNVKLAIDNYHQAAKHCQSFNKSIGIILDMDIEELHHSEYDNVNAAQALKNRYANVAIAASKKAKNAMDTIERMIKEGVQAPPEILATTQRTMKNFRRDLKEAEDEYFACVEKGHSDPKYVAKFMEARQKFKDELEALFPNINLNAKVLELKDGDVDLFLHYIMKQIQFLQNEISQAQTVRLHKLMKAIECNDEQALIEAKADEMLRKEILKKELEYKKSMLKMQSDYNKKIKEELKKQYEYQQEVLQDKLNRKEKEVMGSFSRAVSEQVEKERVAFKKELAIMAGKMKAIEQTLKQRSKAEQESRRSQSLWAAAEALLAATRKPETTTNLQKEIEAVEKAGKDDKLVSTVMGGIPKETRENGIVTEKSLRERFDVIEKSAMKVALVGKDGASLPVYFLSWLQSKLLFMRIDSIPQDELDNKPIDFSKFDTFDIMQRARYHMDRGDLNAALRYMNLLEGGPRAAVICWLEDARKHLEVKQAAETVMAHASVSGMLHS